MLLDYFIFFEVLDLVILLAIGAYFMKFYLDKKLYRKETPYTMLFLVLPVIYVIGAVFLQMGKPPTTGNFGPMNLIKPTLIQR